MYDGDKDCGDKDVVPNLHFYTKVTNLHNTQRCSLNTPHGQRMRYNIKNWQNYSVVYLKNTKFSRGNKQIINQ